jgi:hypothetical protein
MEYTVPQLIAMASGGLNYNPLLAISVNRLLRARSKEQYNVELKNVTDIVNGYESQIVNERKSYGQGALGMPLFQPLTIQSTEGIANDLFLDSAVLQLQRTRNIVTTVVQGRDSSVKEFINNGDWMISVSGIICRVGWEYPLDEVLLFNEYMSLKRSLPIVHELLNSLGIYEAVVTDYAINETSFINCQSYSFNMLSETPIQLQINSLLNNSANI